MKLKDMNFSGLDAVRMKCIGFADDLQRVISKRRELYPMELITGDAEMKGFYLEVTEKRNYTEYGLWNDCKGLFAVKYRIPLDEEHEVSELLMMAKNMMDFKGADGYKEMLRRKEEKGDFITNADIFAMTQLGEPGLAERYHGYRENYLKKRQEEKKQEEAQREAIRKAEEEERKRVLEEKIAEAENCIRTKKRVVNEELEDGRHIVLCLMKKYNISVPLKTQGWINNKLASVIFDDEGVSLQFYRHKGCKCSESVYHYLGLLKAAVDKAA